MQTQATEEEAPEIRQAFESFYFADNAPAHAREQNGGQYKYMATHIGWVHFQAGWNAAKETEAAGQPAQQPTAQAIEALEKRAKKCLIIAAILGKADNMRYWAGSLEAVQSLKSGMAQKMADIDLLRSGYHIPTSFQAAWAAFPHNAKSLTLAEMQEFLRVQGVQITTDPVADREFNGVAKVEDDEFAVVGMNNEQPTLVVDGVDSALHAPPVVNAATVAKAEVAV